MRAPIGIRTGTFQRSRTGPPGPKSPSGSRRGVEPLAAHPAASTCDGMTLNRTEPATESRERLKALLSFEERPMSLGSRTIETGDGHAIERLQFRLPDGAQARGFLVRPARVAEPPPAILLAHAHGGRYEIGARELIDGRPAWLDPPGLALARRGFVALSIDMPTFGSRSGVTESAAAKAALWHGRTLFGQMLGEQAAALTWLAARPDVDQARIGMVGISMGATLAYFLAALDPRVAAVAHLCCYADFTTLVETDAHDLHGDYLTVPGCCARPRPAPSPGWSRRARS